MPFRVGYFYDSDEESFDLDTDSEGYEKEAFFDEEDSDSDDKSMKDDSRSSSADSESADLTDEKMSQALYHADPYINWGWVVHGEPLTRYSTLPDWINIGVDGNVCLIRRREFCDLIPTYLITQAFSFTFRENRLRFNYWWNMRIG